MNNIIEVDVEMQRKLALKSFLDNGGTPIFKRQLEDYLMFASEHVDASIKDGFVDQKDLCKLNYNLGRKQGLQMALSVFDMFVEELEDNSSARRKIAK